MKKRYVVSCVIILILGALAWHFSGQPKTAGKESPIPSAKEKNHAAVQTETPPITESEGPTAENQRTRPSQKPPDRVYAKPKVEFPVAEALQGKPGFVVSPYNSKIIDVNDIPPGTLVQDPSYPSAEKKYFRVP